MVEERRRQQAHGRPRVGHEDLGHGEVELPLHHDRDRTGLDGLGGVVVAVSVLAVQGTEQRSGTDGAAVEVHAGDHDPVGAVVGDEEVLRQLVEQDTEVLLAIRHRGSMPQPAAATGASDAGGGIR